MKKILLILTSTVFAFTVYGQGNGNGNGNRNGNIPTEHNEATIGQLQAEMASGKTSSVHLTREYIARIQALDQSGPNVNSVIELNPDARRWPSTRMNCESTAKCSALCTEFPFCSRITLIPAIKCKPVPDRSRL